MGRIFRPTQPLIRNGQPVLDEHGNVKRVPRTKNWYIRYYDSNGKAHEETSGSDKIGAARKLLTARESSRDKGEPVGNQIGKVTFDDAETDIINDYKANRRRSLAHVQRRITLHLKPVFGGRRLTSITTADVRAFIAARLEKGAAAAEINRELAVLKRMFTLAVDAGKLIAKPKIKMLEERNARKGFFEFEQFEAIRAALPDYLRPFATFCFVTGWRWKSEVLPLRVGQVDLAAGVVRLEPDTTKNDEGRQFHFGGLEELCKVLTKQVVSAERLSRQTGKIVSFVFHEPTGSPIIASRVYRAWKQARQAAGCPTRLLHDFRRTAARNFERAGVQRSAAKSMIGHKTDEMYERYSIVDEARQREASATLNAYLKATPEPTKGAKVQQFRKRAAGGRR